MHQLTFYPPPIGKAISLPLLACRVQAGFPSPADDYLESRIDLNELLIQNPPATFIARVTGESMRDAGIFDGDYVVVNRAAEWSDGSIVIAVIQQNFTLKRIRRSGERVFLKPENGDFPLIEVTEESECEIWECVTGSFRRY